MSVDVSEVDPYTDSQGEGSSAGIPLVRPALELHAKFHGIQGVRELQKEPIPQGLDLSTPMDLEKGSQHPLVLLHET